MPQSKNPLRLEKSFQVINFEDQYRARSTALATALKKMVSKARIYARVPSSPYTTGRVSGKLDRAISFEYAATKDRRSGKLKTLTGVLFADEKKTPTTAERGYALFQEKGTGFYGRRHGYIKPKNGKAMRWIFTAQYRLGRKNNRYQWHLRKGGPQTDLPYRGKYVNAKFRSAAYWRVKGRSVERRANLDVSYDVFAVKVRGVKAKHYLERAFNDPTIRKQYERDFHKTTREYLRKVVTKGSAKSS